MKKRIAMTIWVLMCLFLLFGCTDNRNDMQTPSDENIVYILKDPDLTDSIVIAPKE